MRCGDCLGGHEVVGVHSLPGGCAHEGGAGEAEDFSFNLKVGTIGNFYIKKTDLNNLVTREGCRWLQKLLCQDSKS